MQRNPQERAQDWAEAEVLEMKRKTPYFSYTTHKLHSRAWRIHNDKTCKIERRKRKGGGGWEKKWVYEIREWRSWFELGVFYCLINKEWKIKPQEETQQDSLFLSLKVQRIKETKDSKLIRKRWIKISNDPWKQRRAEDESEVEKQVTDEEDLDSKRGFGVRTR